MIVRNILYGSLLSTTTPQVIRLQIGCMMVPQEQMFNTKMQSMPLGGQMLVWFQGRVPHGPKSEIVLS